MVEQMLAVDDLLRALDDEGYDNAEEVLRTWACLCDLQFGVWRPMSFNTGKLMEALFNHFQHNQTPVIQVCRSVADIIELYNWGFFEDFDDYCYSMDKIQLFLEGGNNNDADRIEFASLLDFVGEEEVLVQKIRRVYGNVMNTYDFNVNNIEQPSVGTENDDNVIMSLPENNMNSIDMLNPTMRDNIYMEASNSGFPTRILISRPSIPNER